MLHEGALNVLLVEDDDNHAKIIENYLRRVKADKPSVSRVSRLEEGKKCLVSGHYDVILLDLRLPDSDLDETLDRTMVVSGNTPIVVLSSIEEKDFARKLVKKGAQDFLCKSNLSEDVIIRTINSSIERKQNEISLRESEARNRGILESSMDCIISTDQDWQITDLNKAGEVMLGFHRHNLIGKNLMESLISPPYHKILKQWRYEVEFHGDDIDHNHRMEMASHRNDGAEFPIEISMTSLMLMQGRIYTFFIRDITEQRLASEFLRLAKEEAVSASRAKSTFLANMSHEIRTPLTAILGFSELLVDPQTTQLERLNFFNSIKRNANHLSQIINDILDLSKVEVGKLTVERKNTLLSEILEDTKATFALQTKEKGIEFSISLEASAENIVIFTDFLRIKQILFNMIGNAIKFTSKGKVTVHVNIERISASSSKLMFVIKDTGIGIDSGSFAKLFTPFSQVDDSTKRLFGGTGLGLTLSRQLARLLGGDIILKESQLGNGSTFVITIDPGPYYKVSNETPVKSATPTPAVVDEHQLEGIKVLVADDAAENRFIINVMLKRAGASVDLVTNGQEVIDKMKSNNYDLIFLDIQMPVMDGYEAVKILRGEGYKGPILAVTAHALDEDRKRCLESGFNDYISKPLNQKTLIEKTIEFSAQKPKKTNT